MCNSCGSKQYGQHQPDARAADKERLKQVAAVNAAKERKRNANLN